MARYEEWWLCETTLAKVFLGRNTLTRVSDTEVILDDTVTVPQPLINALARNFAAPDHKTHQDLDGFSQMGRVTINLNYVVWHKKWMLRVEEP